MCQINDIVIIIIISSQEEILRDIITSGDRVSTKTVSKIGHYVSSSRCRVLMLHSKNELIRRKRNIMSLFDCEQTPYSVIIYSTSNKNILVVYLLRSG